MFKRKCKITFIKHGSTIYSDENRFNDNQNYPPLSELGKIEASNISQWITKRSPKIDKLYTSSDLKSIQTCEYIAEEYNIDFETVENLHSKFAGPWDGLTFDQIEKQHPQELENYHQDRANYWPEPGETNTQLFNRVRENISKIISQNIGKRIIIVCSGDIIQAEICAALNIPIENIGKIYIPSGSATQLSYFDGWTSLVYSAHVPI